jgi:elongation factor P
MLYLMLLASEVRDGMAIKHEGVLYKVIAAEFKAGTAKMQSLVHLKLRNIETHTLTEPRFHPEARIETVSLETLSMEYQFHDNSDYYFMHPQTYEQIPFPKERLGNFTKFMTAGMKMKVEFLEDKPIDIALPKTVDLKVISTGSGVKSDHGSALKPAELENGMEIAVPQFIKAGDTVRLDVETEHYLDRIS